MRSILCQTSGRYSVNDYIVLSSTLLSFFFAFIFATSLPCLADEDTTGVGIFDTLFIAAGENFQVAGNLYLQEAHVLGKGTLRLQSDRPQHIISRHSQVTKLHLLNPTQVSLQGELLISQSLTVEKGVFAIKTADLVVADTAQVLVHLGGRMCIQATKIAVLPFKNTIPYSGGFSLDAILGHLSLFSWSCLYEQVCTYSLLSIAIQHPGIDVYSPPPEEV